MSTLAATADRLHSGAIHLLRAVRARDAEAGLSPARLSALSVLVFAGPRSLGRLADAEQVRPPTMSALVRGLEGAGRVRRRPDPDDARAGRLEATARGRRLLERARARRLETLTGMLEPLSAADRDCLDHAGRILARLATAAASRS